jgi:hypothetical protein
MRSPGCAAGPVSLARARVVDAGFRSIAPRVRRKSCWCWCPVARICLYLTPFWRRTYSHLEIQVTRGGRCRLRCGESRCRWITPVTEPSRVDGVVVPRELRSGGSDRSAACAPSMGTAAPWDSQSSWPGSVQGHGRVVCVAGRRYGRTGTYRGYTTPPYICPLFATGSSSAREGTAQMASILRKTAIFGALGLVRQPPFVS